ncbi:histidinol-phosphate aminotransferase [Arenicella chitinivorans]|uniref:Histidinol-phosphate aminotransferase n=1 Tax=Arenicella chitinivorans TaxID=1329800 RepID=A0A918VPU8_9GAMM|nr:histidinol-phosphate transaminase [Arenicella chitinivorans]GHA12953.1 histidinol-phosphate aminotransferase [Arenicella chitinivorans]
MSQYWSEIVHELTPYVPGEQPKLNNLIKLNTNENPYGPSPRVLAAIQQATSHDLRKYPDPSASVLKSQIAQYYSVQPDWVCVGNSSDEVLAHAFRALLKHPKPLLFPDITYSFYPVYCGLFDITYQEIPLRTDFTVDLDDYYQDNGGIIFANPNAPTGINVGLSVIRGLLERNRYSVVVVDEAYVDFGGESATALVREFPNLLVIQTLSKSRGLAGLRVGFAVGDPGLISGMERVKNSFHPYALSALALAGAKAAFEDDAYFQQTRDKVIQTRAESIKGLESLGFEVLPSAANFVFTTHPKHSAKSMFQALRARNIIVRYFDRPRLKDYLRISIGTDQEMAMLISALTEITA